MGWNKFPRNAGLPLSHEKHWRGKKRWGRQRYKLTLTPWEHGVGLHVHWGPLPADKKAAFLPQGSQHACQGKITVTMRHCKFYHEVTCQDEYIVPCLGLTWGSLPHGKTNVCCLRWDLVFRQLTCTFVTLRKNHSGFSDSENMMIHILLPCSRNWNHFAFALRIISNFSSLAFT